MPNTEPFIEIIKANNGIDRKRYALLKFFLNFSRYKRIHGKRENASISGLKVIIIAIAIGRKFNTVNVAKICVLLNLK